MRVNNGFTLIELLVVTSIIAILMALLFPVMSAIRERANRASALATITELVLAVETYQSADERGRYPDPQMVGGQGVVDLALVVLLEDMRLFSRGERPIDGNNLLIDPWMRPFHYQLDRPAPANDAAMANWNWDSDKDDVRKQGSALARDNSGVGLVDPTNPANKGSAAIALQPLDFPYIYSLGPTGLSDDATDWIFKEDGQ